jgi:hypothetical protein
MKTTTRGHGSHAIVLVVALLSAACGRDNDAKTTPEAAPVAKTTAPPPSAPETTTPKPPPAARVTNRVTNEKGQVLVVEYHHIAKGKGDMFRTPEEFRGDLERLYKMGFRPCTVTDYLDGKFPIPPGASPAVFTFDDSNPSQFQMKDDGTVDPNCAIGIWMDFAKTHPDFPVRGTFYVLPDVMWAQPKMRERKVAMLKELGCEMGSHTVTHPILKRLSDEKVKEELAGAIDHLEKMGTPSPVSIALPFGVSPKNTALLREFEHGGKTYRMKAAFLVGANPAPAPTNPKLNRYRIPRIQAYNGPYGLGYWLDRVEKGEVKPFVQ